MGLADVEGPGYFQKVVEETTERPSWVFLAKEVKNYSPHFDHVQEDHCFHPPWSENIKFPLVDNYFSTIPYILLMHHMILNILDTIS